MHNSGFLYKFALLNTLLAIDLYAGDSKIKVSICIVAVLEQSRKIGLVITLPNLIYSLKLVGYSSVLQVHASTLLRTGIDIVEAVLVHWEVVNGVVCDVILVHGVF